MKALCLRCFILKPVRQSIDSLKKRCQGFSKELSIWEIGMFLCDHHWKLWMLFTTLTSKQIFWQTKTSFKKQEYAFIFESTKTEGATFPHETTIPESNVKTNRMESTKWTYQKEQSFVSNSFIFLTILFQCKDFFQRVD